MTALLSKAFAVGAYAVFLGVFLYLIGFVGGFGVPKSLDTGGQVPWGEALIVDLLLLGLFAVQHSVMARASFKRMWTRLVPPALERSTYVLLASLTLVVLYALWRPITQPIWVLTAPAAIVFCQGVFWFGWTLVLLSTFLINHFELFGLSQAFSRATGRPRPEAQFRTPLLYRYVRHPLYLGFVLSFWATPNMTAGHLLFASGSTGYILLGIWFEERDLIARFGERYRSYREGVGMLIPWRRSKAGAEARSVGVR